MTTYLVIQTNNADPYPVITVFNDKESAINYMKHDYKTELLINRKSIVASNLLNQYASIEYSSGNNIEWRIGEVDIEL